LLRILAISLGSAVGILLATPIGGTRAEVIKTTNSSGQTVQTIRVTDAKGPGSLSVRCADYLDKAADPKPPKPSPSKKHTPPDPSGMPVLLVDNSETAVSDLPGSAPERLPLQQLEGSPEVLRRIRNVLRGAKSGKRTRLSFFGASHTGADMWTGRIRRLLQDRFGDLGHGYILPAALYKGYRGSDVNLCRTNGWLSDWVGKGNGHKDGLLGPAGMSVSSSNARDFGWIETTRSNKHGRKVSSFEVLALAQPNGGGLLLQVDEGQVHRIATASDSAALQRVRVEVPDGAHRLHLRPAGDGEVRIFGVSMEREGGGILVDAMGIRGRQMKTWLQWDQNLARDGLAALAPDLVVLAYGTNEASHQNYTMDEYRADLGLALSQLRSRLPAEVPCILAGPSDRGMRLGDNRFAIWDRTAPVSQVQRELSSTYGCAFWDWQEATGGPGSMVAWYFTQPRMAAADLIHFNRRGYQWLGDRFVAALDALDSHPELE
jgi:lysophospholipase L1-like esterase